MTSRRTGGVTVGVTHDTAEFAVESIRRWWRLMGQRSYPAARTVCHYPPGTSQWNAIEHRLFSFISVNWKGQPLVSYEAVVNLIGPTRTRTGLTVRAVLDSHDYSTGQAVTPTPMTALSLKGQLVSSRLELHAVTADPQSPILIPDLF
jgi:hypothetical protein